MITLIIWEKIEGKMSLEYEIVEIKEEVDLDKVIEIIEMKEEIIDMI